jgi:hypothetical protein
MKKIELVLFIVSIWFISCGERYEEERGAVFEGTWALEESYVGSDTVESNKRKFLTAREFEGENLLLFYSGGHYDSSFFFRVQDNNIFVRRVSDSVDVIHSYYLTKADGSDSLDNSGNKILRIDTLREVVKPLTPKTDYSPEKYYGKYSFPEGPELTLKIERYPVDNAGKPNENVVLPSYTDIYKRPVEIE